jgi:tetratricopeptide (TPR) repeat protein
LPDRRALEKTLADLGRLLNEREFGSVEEANAFLQQLMAAGSPLPSQPRTPLEQAQDLMYRAWETAAPKRRVELARQALAVSGDCADAYVLLAEEAARTPQEAKELFEAGVQAGERALGAEAFVEGVGHFWGIIETRPYMRAREGLAAVLWFLGRRSEAIAHYQEMLRLNPNDNQGVRYALANHLLEVGDDRRLASLLEQYEGDAMAAWAYTRVLLAYRQTGDSPGAAARLREARRQNPFVPPYLLGEKRLPRRLPDYVGFGDESEAIAYVAEAGHLWAQQAGALDWLRRNDS